MNKRVFSDLIPRLSLAFLVTTQASAQLGSDLRITAVDTLITYESGTLAGAVDLHVGPDGEVYVVDRLNSQVHRLAASGEQLSSVGTFPLLAEGCLGMEPDGYVRRWADGSVPHRGASPITLRCSDEGC